MDLSALTVSNEAFVNHFDGKMVYARMWNPSIDARQSQLEAPIVLFHDSLGCVDLWREFPAKLSVSTKRRVIAYDRLGFGKSSPRKDKLPTDFIADEATTYFPVIREQLGFQEFIVFGHSVGGGMAINCAAGFPIDCRGLITESAQIFPEDRTLKRISIAKEQFKDDKQVKRLKKYHGEKAKWVLDAWTETWLDPRFASWSLANVLPRVSCPVLAIHGELDEYGSTRHPEMIGELCHGPAHIEILPEIHHVPHRERPDLILDLVCRFVASLH